MTDKVLDAVARLSGRTHILLMQMADRFEECGLPEWASIARKMAREHAEQAIDCHEDTQPTLTDGRRRHG